MKNKKVLIIGIILLLIVILGVGAFLFINQNSNKLSEQMVELRELVTAKKYEQAKALIQANELLSLAEEEILDLFVDEISTYKIEERADLEKVTNDEWEKIREVDSVLTELNIKREKRKFRYLDELLKLKEYVEYMPAIRWVESEDYEVWNEYMEFDEANTDKISKLFREYSFEKYGIENLCIKELNIEKENIANYWESMIKAVSNNNTKQFDTIYDQFVESRTNVIKIQMEIVTIQYAIDTGMANLSAIME